MGGTPAAPARASVLSPARNINRVRSVRPPIIAPIPATAPLQMKINELTAKTTPISEPGRAIEVRIERLRGSLTTLLYLQRGQASKIAEIIEYIDELKMLHASRYHGNTNYQESDDIAKDAAAKAKSLLNEILVFKGMHAIGGSKTRRHKKNKTRSNRKKSNRKR